MAEALISIPKGTVCKKKKKQTTKKPHVIASADHVCYLPNLGNTYHWQELRAANKLCLETWRIRPQASYPP